MHAADGAAHPGDARESAGVVAPEAPKGNEAGKPGLGLGPINGPVWIDVDGDAAPALRRA